MNTFICMFHSLILFSNQFLQFANSVGFFSSSVQTFKFKCLHNGLSSQNDATAQLLQQKTNRNETKKRIKHPRGDENEMY